VAGRFGHAGERAGPPCVQDAYDDEHRLTTRSRSPTNRSLAGEPSITRNAGRGRSLSRWSGPVCVEVV